jgi:hypothetical protein
VEVRVAEICGVSYVDVVELHCRCGLVARTVKSESVKTNPSFIYTIVETAQQGCQYKTALFKFKYTKGNYCNGIV